MATKKTFVCSDESEVNSYGFRVMTAGIDMSQFKKNPVLLKMHERYGKDYEGPPGRWEKMVKKDGQLLAEPVFDMEDSVGKSLSRKVDNDFMKGASVGLIPVEWSNDPKHMLPGQSRPTLLKSKLVEISIVDIPSSDAALALYDDDGNKLDLLAEMELLQLSMPCVESPKSQSNSNTNTMTKEELAALCIALGLSTESTPAVITAGVLKLKSDHDAVKQKNDQLELSMKAAKEADIVALVDQAIKDKKISETLKDTYVKLAQGDFEGIKKVLAEMKAPVIPLNLLGRGGDGKTVELAADRQSWSHLDWLRNDSAGFQKLKAEDPTTWQKIVDDSKAATQKRGAYRP